MPMKFKIHPAVGVARLGDSPDEFYLAPEQPGALPIDCDDQGVALPGPDGGELAVDKFKDPQGRVKRQAARFRIFAHNDAGGGSRELAIGDTIEFVSQRTGQVIEGRLTDVSWTAYLANKKACWYEFEQLDGEHGYSASHTLRNADVVGDTARSRLIIDPGPQTVTLGLDGNATPRPHAAFARGGNPNHAQVFPPPLSPFPIDTLGELIVSVDGDGHNRLALLGGFGNSGSYHAGAQDPIIQSYANNDGWFDDVADGPVTATLTYETLKINGRKPRIQKGSGSVQVHGSAWAVVGYPSYAPQLLDMITGDELVYDVFVRNFAYDTAIFGVPPFGQPAPQSAEALSLWRSRAQWNSDYYPRFWRDIWPIFQRPDNFRWLLDWNPFAGADPHNKTPGAGGNLDPELLSIPPHHGQDPDERQMLATRRQFIYDVLRKPDQRNLYRVSPDPDRPNYRNVGMPLLCGDNPITNTLVDKFLSLTETQLFLLRQWAAGRFVNERSEHLEDADSTDGGVELDRGVLGNVLGGAFCPGGEVTWIFRNPAIWDEPYRIRQSDKLDPRTLLPRDGQLSLESDLAAGLEPGDLTKYNALPWQADFNECSTQDIDITYAGFNSTNPDSVGDPVPASLQTTFWWPAHRPLHVFLDVGGPQRAWSRGVPASELGDLFMVTAWKALGFVREKTTDQGTAYVEVERNPELDPRPAEPAASTPPSDPEGD